MLKNYIKIAFRNLFRSKLFSIINILGLSLGIASAIIIFLFVKNDLTYDAYNKDAENIYLVQKCRTTGMGTKILDDTWFPLMDEMKETYPGVTDGVRIYEDDAWIKSGSKKINETITYADQSIFNVFTMPLAMGDKNSVFSDRYSVVISKQIAEKYFGNENPIGKIFTVNFDTDYKVTGVLEDLPGNLSFTPEIIANIDSDIDPADINRRNDWNGAFLYTFLKLDANTNAASLEAQFPGFVSKIWGTDGANGSAQMKLQLLPLLEYHDSQYNTKTFSYVLICIALGILLIASINFMNLSTAKSLERIHEIGMRKILGAQKKKIISQFLGESLMLSLIALVFGIALAEVLLPQVNKLYDLNLSLSFFSNLEIPIMLLSIWLITGIVSGSYPALRISRFTILESMKGKVRSSSSGVVFRNALIAFQFTLTVMLIAGTLVILDQTNYMKDYNLNFEKENVLVMPLSLGDFADSESTVSRIDVLKNELKKNPAVTSVSSSMSVPGRVVNANVFAEPEDWQSPDPLRMRITTIDQNFFDVYKIDLIEGRNFSEKYGSDQDNSIIINETAMRGMDWNSAVNKQVKVGGNLYTVIGVTKDYNTESLENEVRPLIHIFRTTESNTLGYISVKLNTSSISSTLNFIKQKWESLDPGREFEYFFIDKNFDVLYKSQERTIAVVSYFSMLAVIIACLGLFGLLLMTINRKTKEIGIRKILGADVSSILLLLSKKILYLVVLANIIALPVIYFLMQQWLEDFAYRINISIWTLLLSGSAVLVATLLTVSVLLIKAANMNPVNALKYE